MTPVPSPHCCPACEGTRFTTGPVVPVSALGWAWAADRAGNGSPPSDADAAAWAERIRRAIGSDVIQFSRCTECGVEASSPARCWPEGSYTEDENYPPRWEFGRFLDDLDDLDDLGAAPVRLLELGVGEGTFLKMATERGHRGTGLDFNRSAVAVAKSRGLNVALGGFEQLASSGRAEPFDAVAMFHVIEHLPDPAAVLRLLCPFVRVGTLLGISCPAPRRFTRLIGVQQVAGRDFWDYPPHHVLRWTADGLREVLERTGWEVVASEEEPLVLRDAAAQLGVTRAMWKGYADRPLRRRLGIAAARLRLVWERAVSRPTGLSLYTLARYRGGPS